jgi:hypothetical protein
VVVVIVRVMVRVVVRVMDMVRVMVRVMVRDTFFLGLFPGKERFYEKFTDNMSRIFRVRIVEGIYDCYTYIGFYDGFAHSLGERDKTERERERERTSE